MLRGRGIRRLRVHHVVMQQKQLFEASILAICVVRVEELRFAWLVGRPRNMKSRRKSCMSEVVGARSSMWPRVQARSRLSARVQESCQHGRARDRATEHVMPAPSVKMMCSEVSCITSAITEPEPAIVHFKTTRKSGFACIALLCRDVSQPWI